MSNKVPETENKNTSENEWMTIAQAMAYTQLSRTTLYRLMDDGILPFYRVAGTRQRRFKRSELDQLMIREEPGKSGTVFDDEEDEQQ